MKRMLIAAFGVVAAAGSGLAETYEIRVHAPESWVAYYQRIGLGTVERGPFSAPAAERLAAHCRFLEDNTGSAWIPLGYSIEFGYRLCYRTGPFSQPQADEICARLTLPVREINSKAIVCGTEE